MTAKVIVDRSARRAPSSLPTIRKGATKQKVTIPSSALQPTFTVAEVERAIALSSGVVKVVTGVGNSAAHLIMLNSLAELKKTKLYRHQAKRAFKLALEEMEKYRRDLLHPTTGVRYFHLADLTPKERARYAPDATDADYFAFWENGGAVAYERTKPFITSLWNKYRLSLVAHDIPNENALAWVMTAAAALRAAISLYHLAIDDCCQGHGLPKALLEYFFHPFDLSNVSQRWERALSICEPLTDTYELTEVEDRNIMNGVNQLREIWINPDNIFGSTIESIQDYDEIFSTHGNQKRAAQGMAEVLSGVKEELRKN